MEWINDTQKAINYKAINYIEDNLLEAVSVEDVANHIHSSSNHFQKIFYILTGLSISELY